MDAISRRVPGAVHGAYGQLLARLPETVRNQPRAVGATLAAVSIIGLARATASLRRDYRSWMDLERGGLPHNFFGYLIAQMLRPLTGETRGLGPYEVLRAGSKLENTSFLAGPIMGPGPITTRPGDLSETAHDAHVLPARAGPRPNITHHIVPSRQLDMKATAALRDALEAGFHARAKADGTVIEYGRSVIEGNGPALLLRAAEMQRACWHARAAHAPREIAHLHRSEGSLHLFLSARDATTVIRQGWGERHPLSGRPMPHMRIGAGYLMIYAPRDEAELKVVLNILQAGVRYATEGRAS